MNKCFIVAMEDEVSGYETIFGHPILISGVGKLNSSLCAIKAINLGFKEIINIGSCGSKQHKKGELLKIGRTIEDIDVSPIFPYGNNSPSECEIIIDDKSSVVCFTTDYFFDEKQINKYSPNYIQKVESSSVFDMECFAIAKACKNHNIKFSSYKWVSDEGEFDNWQINCKIGLNYFFNEFEKNI